MRTTTVLCSGTVAVADANPSTPPAPVVVGGPEGVWVDDSDATYAEITESGVFSDAAQCLLDVTPSVTGNLSAKVVVHMRYQAMSGGGGPPGAAISEAGVGGTFQLFARKFPGGSASLTPAWTSVELEPDDSEDMESFLENVALTGGALLSIFPTGITTRIFEAYVTVQGPGGQPHWLRHYPREGGWVRRYPDTSYQRTLRRAGGYR